MIIFSKTFVAICRCPQRLICYISDKWRLRQAARALRASYGLQAAGIAQEMGADYAQAGALKEAVFWLQMTQHLQQRACCEAGEPKHSFLSEGIRHRFKGGALR